MMLMEGRTSIVVMLVVLSLFQQKWFEVRQDEWMPDAKNTNIQQDELEREETPEEQRSTVGE